MLSIGFKIACNIKKFGSIAQFVTTRKCHVVKLDNEEFNLKYLTNASAGVAVMSMNRPKARNSLGRNLLEQFNSAFEIVKDDNNIRVLIIRSEVANIFCAGADLKERAAMKPEEVGPFVAKLQSIVNSINTLPIPTIAALDGAALGGGLEMALSCDLRIAASNAKMGLIETKLAIIPGGGGTQRLPRLIGVAKAMELIYTGYVLDGDEAKDIGVVNHSVKQNNDNNAAYLKSVEIASEICKNGPIAVKMAKKAISTGIEVDLKTGLEIERLCYAQTIPTKDRIEGLKAFKEKRLPVYKGH